MAFFQAAGLNIKTYPYYDYENKCLDFDGMLATLKRFQQMMSLYRMAVVITQVV
jgi:aspartate/tyrosine/aromatic aminotransferase